MKMNKLILVALLPAFVLIACSGKRPQDSTMARSTPESEGVSSASIVTFLDSVSKSRHEIHSFMFLRHGKVIAEAWWKPYGPDLKHTLYSASKSFTSTAVGFAVNEKLISVEDKVISFFPNDLPDTMSSFLSDLRIKDLLSMSAGMEPDPTFSVISRDSNWVKGFLKTPILNKPGTKFLYNSLATYMLSAIVQKVTGEKVVDYLAPRLFKPLGIQGMDWEQDLRGINTGGWGLRLRTEDMAKFGQFYLQKGHWNGKQLLPASWIEEATSFKIDQAPDMPKEKKDSSDWTQGYCYQFWRCRYHAFRADGAYGQFVIVMPGEDAVIAITAESSDMPGELNMVWKYLLPGMHSEKMPEDLQAGEILKQKLSRLAVPQAAYKADSSMEREITDRTYRLAPNEKNLESLTFTFADHRCMVKEKTATVSYDLIFDPGTWHVGETNKPGPSLLKGARENNGMIFPAKVAGSYTWKDHQTLELVLRYIESPHTETLICRFDKDNMDCDLLRSQDFGAKSIKLTGKMEKGRGAGNH
jgi:CubicO group peptidase (beta-lactamase class C family)